MPWARMRRWRQTLWTAFAGLMAMSAGCESTHESPYFGTIERVGKEETTIYINNTNEPQYLDPGKASDTGSGALIQQMFEGLTNYGEGDLRPTQGVATHWEQSNDNRIFRFHLRRDARWSDGKPVTAYDFEYAWKRVLRPATASTSATNLYVLKNGELFNRGQLKALQEDTAIRTAPNAEASVAFNLRKGEFVSVLIRSPMKVNTKIDPLATIPACKRGLSHAKEEGKTKEQLTCGDFEFGPSAEGRWAGKEVEIVEAGPAISCNDAPHRWFVVQRGSERGWLPSCLLSSVKDAKNAYALVSQHRSLPTYDPAVPISKDTDDEPTGFVPEAVLMEDDTAVGVRAVDELTLDVELERPTPYFTDLTSNTTLMPVRKDVVEPFEKRGESDLWFRLENIVVNGPYTLDTWKFRYEITMKRNPMYWNHDKLKVHRIVWLEVESAHASMNLYKSGELDYLGDNTSLPSEYMAFLQTKKDFRRSRYLSTYWYEFNVKKPPVDDVRVRWALNLAVDKQQLVDKVTRSGQEPATHYVPEFTGSGYAEQAAEDKERGVDPFSTPEVMFNPERGRALLKEAGYEVVEDGGGYRAVGFPTLEILYNTNEGHRNIAVAIQDMWKRHLGISATLRNEEWKVFLRTARDGQFQVTRYGWVGEYNHPHTWLGTLLSYSPQNWTGWADNEYDELIQRAATTADQKESIRLYRQAEKKALDGMAKMPLYFYTKSTLLKPWVKGYISNARNIHMLKWFWIDPNWRENDDTSIAYPSLEVPKPGELGSNKEMLP